MNKIAFILSVALGVCLASCDSYLDINDDPNQATAENVETDMLMPSIEMNMAASYGDYLRITGGYFSEVYAHLYGTSNYIGYSQFEQSATRSSFAYDQLMQGCLSNIVTLQQKAEASEEWGTYLAGAVIRAFAYEALVDCYGEVPYTEAFDANNLNPHYDDGQTIYEGLIAELDDALSKANSASLVCTNFLYPNDATAVNWVKFANALKLKLLMRMANVKDVSAEVGALIEEDNFPTEDVAYTSCWGTSATDMSPFYAEEFATNFGSTQLNICGNVAIICTMNQIDYQDPRLPVYFETNSEGKYIGSVSGTNYSPTNSLTDWCRPVASADMPVYLITVSEVEYFIAEYYARYGSATKAAEHYAAAIEASFQTAGVDGAAEYIARYPYDNDNYKKCLGETKWVALAGTNPYEAWCEARRLRYPAFSGQKGTDFYTVGNDDSYDTSSYVPFTFYTPIQVFALVGDSHLLERFPYSESSTAYNSNAPTFANTDYTKPVFWAE
ncbi:MAG: SusD/RagB family nutrient-binding outer membrane lipoprotein [Prevotellaceae bacterium]|nr:SusD/RagB family nutrient-binding outer membrane lipoprotein [Prevotellaceae bacterium]